MTFVEELPVFGVLNGLLGVGFFGAVASMVVRFRDDREAVGVELTGNAIRPLGSRSTSAATTPVGTKAQNNPT